MDRKEQEILAVMIAHNEQKCVQMNVNILLNECADIGCEVLVVDNASDDGLKDWLASQHGISYMISDEVEGYGNIWKVISEEFGSYRYFLLLRANYILTPGCAAALKSVLDLEKEAAAAAPVSNGLAGEQKCFGVDSYDEALKFKDTVSGQKIVMTAYLDADIMMIRGSTFGWLDTNTAIPRAVMRGYRRKALEHGYSFAVVKKAVCFAVCGTQDEPYRKFDAELYKYEKIQQLLYAFGDVTYQGIHFYKYLEPDILLAINYHNGLQDTDRNIGSLVWSAADNVVLSNEDDANKTRKMLECLPQRDVLFVTLMLRRMYHGEFIHTAMEPYIQSLEEDRYLDLECVTDLSVEGALNIPTKNRYPVLVTAVPKIFGIPQVQKEELDSFLWKSFVHPLEEAMGCRFHAAVLRACFLKAAFILKERASFMIFFRKVLETVKPRVVIYSHGQNRLLTYMQDISSEMGIPTLEITHGVTAAGVYHKHLMYSDALLVFSSIVAKKSRLLGNGHVVAVGKPGIYEHCKASDKKNLKIVVSFISSLEMEILPYAKNLAKRLDPKKYLVIYKIHGAEMWKKSEMEQAEREYPVLKFAGGSLDIRDVASMSDIVVGIRSSGIFDTLAYTKVKIITVRDRALDYGPAQQRDVLQEVADQGDIVMVENEEGLYREVLNYRRNKAYRKVPNCFWPADAEDRFKKLVDSYVYEAPVSKGIHDV